MDDGASGTATIYAVAAAAGTSIASVSRVLRGDRRVSEPLRRRVAVAVERLDYVPSGPARSLAAGRHHAYGLVLGDLAGDYFPALAMGFESAAAEAGSSVVLQVADRRSEPALAARGLLARVDALAIGPSALPDDAIERLARRVPVVLLGRTAVADCDAVLTESVGAMRSLVGHLIADGRRRLLFAGDVEGSWDARERARGFGEACDAAGIGTPPALQTAQTEADGLSIADGLVDRVRRGELDGIVCVNDELALALLTRFTALGLRVPHDVALTGFDDVAAAHLVVPGLTTVRQPVFALGREGAGLLERRIADADAGRQVRVLPTELVLRGSCGDHLEAAA